MAVTSETRHLTSETDCDLSTTVVTTVSTATDTPIDELPELYDVIDPDALDRLFFNKDTEGKVKFQYADCIVTVHSDQMIEVSPAS